MKQSSATEYIDFEIFMMINSHCDLRIWQIARRQIATLACYKILVRRYSHLFPYFVLLYNVYIVISTRSKYAFERGNNVNAEAQSLHRE